MLKRVVLPMSIAFAALLTGLVALSGAATFAQEPSPLKVEMTAMQDGNTVRYSITLVNDSSQPVGDIFVAGKIPAGATFGQATAAPTGTWFRGVEGVGTELVSAVWLAQSVPARGRVGPFGYTVTATGTVPSASAWVSWRAPSAGIVSSVEIMAGAYVGSESCASCHASNYNDFRVSGHPYKLRSVEEAIKTPNPLPAGYTWDDISYMIGGYKWKTRYMDKQGFILTSTADGKPGKTQYNIATGRFVDYEPGVTKKYDCGSCHNTGYSPVGHQNDMPGIVGTWALDGVQCEACHGPGGQHVSEAGGKNSIKVDRSTAVCAGCHTRGTADKIPAAAGFIRHQEQNNELVASPHKELSCVTCHNPHKKAEFSIKNDCATCHAKATDDFRGSKMQKVGLSCTDCHMAKALKSAENYGTSEGDIKSHTFRINSDPTAKMFTDDGAFAKGFLTLDFSCLSCHKDRDLDWAASLAKQAHTLGK